MLAHHLLFPDMSASKQLRCPGLFMSRNGRLLRKP